MIIDSVFAVIDEKIASIETEKKRASVIVINENLFKQMQQEMLGRDMSQRNGVVRSPYALQVYRGAKVITSQVADTIEVF
jgi:hypothetical protein